MRQNAKSQYAKTAVTDSFVPPNILRLVLSGLLFMSVIIILRGFLLWRTQIPAQSIATLTNQIGQVRYLSQSMARHALEIAMHQMGTLSPRDSVRLLQMLDAEAALLLQRTNEIEAIARQGYDSDTSASDYRQIIMLSRRYTTIVQAVTTGNKNLNACEAYDRAVETSTHLGAAVNRLLRDREERFAVQQSRINMLNLSTLLLTVGLLGAWALIFWRTQRRYQTIAHRHIVLEQQAEKERVAVESLVNAVNGIFWEADAETFQFTYISAAVEKILGYTALEWMGSPTFWQDHLHPDERQAKIDFCMAATQDKQDHDFEYRFIKADSTVVWLRDIVTVEVENGKAVRLKGIMVDITEQKHQARELRNAEEHFRSAVNALGEGIVLQDSNGGIVFCNPRAEEILGLSADQMTGRTSLDPHWRAVHEDGTPFPGAEHPAMVTLRTGEGQHNVVMGVHKPNGELTWILVNSQPIHYASTVEVSGVVASFTDITIQKQQEEELRHTGERFRNLFLHSRDAILETAVDGRIVSANPEACRIFGRTEEEIVRLGRAGVVDGTDPRLPILAKERAEKGYAFGELTFIRGDGTLFQGEASSSVFSVGDTVMHTSMIIRDITERKKTEQTLKESEERFRLITENTLDLIAQHTPEGNYTYISPSVEMILGYRSEELLGKNPYDLFHPDDQERIRNESHTQALRGEIGKNITYRILCKDGSYRWLETKTKPLFADGTSTITALQTFSRDVTERTQAEAKLRENEQFISRLLQAVPGGVYVFDMDENRNVFATDSHTTLLGYSPQEIQAMGATFIDQCFHLEDRDELRKHIERLDTNPIGTVSDLTYRFRHKDGRWIWLLSREVVLEHNSQTDKHVQHLGVAIDVTALKEAHRELAESNDRLRTLIASIPVPIAVNRVHDGKALYNNAALREYFNLPSDIALHPESINFYAHSEDRARFVEELQSKGKVDKQEIHLKTLQGEDRWGIVSAMPLTFNGDQAVVAAFNDITKRKNAEDALLRSEANLRAVFDASVQIHYLIAPDFHVLAFNKLAGETIRNLLKQEIILGSDIRTLIVPNDVESFEQHFQEVLAGSQLRFEKSLALPQREVLWFEFQFIPVFAANGEVITVSFSALDITAQKNATNKLLKSEQRYRSFIELQGTYFTRTDLEGRYTYASPSMVRDYSPDGASAIGKHGYEHIIPDDHDLARQTVERCFQAPGMPFFVTLRKPHVSGDIKTTEWEFIAISDSDGSISEIQCVGHDVTARVAAHEEIIMLNKTLELRVEQRTKALVALNNEKNEFLGIAAHDLKNPLAGILSSAEILQRYYADDAEVKRFVDMIMSASDQMMKIISNLLDVNRLESGKMMLNLNPISLAVIEPIVEEYQQRASRKGIVVHYESSADRPLPVVLADEQALWQLVDNLVSNAVKYSPHWKSVWVRLLRQTNESGTLVGRIEVKDEGPGISEEDKKRMFGKFERLTAQPTGGENSTGLGLSIVKKLVEMQNGHIWCESELGKGATFIVELPLADTSSLAAETPTHSLTTITGQVRN